MGVNCSTKAEGSCPLAAKGAWAEDDPSIIGSKARKPELYDYDDVRFESFLDQITVMYSSAVAARSEPFKPAFVVAGPGKDCGRPFDRGL